VDDGTPTGDERTIEVADFKVRYSALSNWSRVVLQRRHPHLGRCVIDLKPGAALDQFIDFIARGKIFRTFASRG